jgi:hypothetical protein
VIERCVGFRLEILCSGAMGMEIARGTNMEIFWRFRCCQVCCYLHITILSGAFQYDVMARLGKVGHKSAILFR